MSISLKPGAHCMILAMILSETKFAGCIVWHAHKRLINCLCAESCTIWEALSVKDGKKITQWAPGLK